VNRETKSAAVLLGALVAVAVIGPLVAPYEPTEIFDMATMRAQPPSLAHPFGTDPNARDVLSRLLHGARTSLGIAGLAVAVALSLGTLIGVTAARASGVVDAILMRVTDAAFAFPRLLLLLLVVASVEDLSPAAFALVIGATGWMNTARLARAETARLLVTDHVRAARVLGVPWPRLLLRHLLPGLLPTLIAAGTIAFAAAIPLEAALSFLGVGVQPPDPSWGNIINEAESMVVRHWWMVLFPTVAIVSTVLATTAVAERLGDSVGRVRS
jgi:ABC-type dipeptide/oligopeptide/nickel transport system permease subunit